VNSSDPIDVLNIKLKRFKMFFKGWGSNLFGHLRKKKAGASARVREFRKNGGINGFVSC
jgi:hypothetical protein